MTSFRIHFRHLADVSDWLIKVKLAFRYPCKFLHIITLHYNCLFQKKFTVIFKIHQEQLLININ